MVSGVAATWVATRAGTVVAGTGGVGPVPAVSNCACSAGVSRATAPRRWCGAVATAVSSRSSRSATAAIAAAGYPSAR